MALDLPIGPLKIIFGYDPVPRCGVTKAVVCAILSVGWCI